MIYYIDVATRFRQKFVEITRILLSVGSDPNIVRNIAQPKQSIKSALDAIMESMVFPSTMVLPCTIHMLNFKIARKCQNNFTGCRAN